jgi:hypothetical protein
MNGQPYLAFLYVVMASCKGNRCWSCRMFRTSALLQASTSATPQGPQGLAVMTKAVEDVLLLPFCNNPGRREQARLKLRETVWGIRHAGGDAAKAVGDGLSNVGRAVDDFLNGKHGKGAAAGR